jgi:hypothetical protein
VPTRLILRLAFVCCLLAWRPLFAYEVAASSEKWGAPVFGTPGGVVTWSITPGTATAAGYPYVPLDTFLPSGYEAHLQWAFAQWSAVSNIQFQEVSDNGAAIATTPNAGVIRISGIALDSASGVMAQTSGPIGPESEAAFAYASTVRFTSTLPWSYSDNGPGYNFDRVALHEIGHLLGLQHETSIPALMNPTYSTALALGLQADDSAGAQFIYGPVGGSSPAPEPSTLAVVLGACGWLTVRRSRPRASRGRPSV